MLAAPCSQPDVIPGQPVLSEFAKDRQALANCAARHRDTVTFYGGVRRRFSH